MRYYVLEVSAAVALAATPPLVAAGGCAQQQCDVLCAEDYANNSTLQWSIAQHFLGLLKERFPALPPRAVVLDVGCGDGRVTSSIHAVYRDIRIVGVDASRDMIDFANRHYRDGATRFAVDRAEELATVAPASVDAITSFACLHWVPDHRSAFQRMYAVLKPGGWAGLVFPADTGSVDALDEAWAQVLNEASLAAYLPEATAAAQWNMAKPSAIQQHMEQAGFEVLAMAVHTLDHYFADAEAFENAILACAQDMRSLPVDLQRRCAQRIVELYRSATADLQPDDGRCVYRLEVLMVLAIKPAAQPH